LFYLSNLKRGERIKRAQVREVQKHHQEEQKLAGRGPKRSSRGAKTS
jgi:hypothetical protein